MYVSKDVTSELLSAAFENFELPVSGPKKCALNVAQSCAYAHNTRLVVQFCMSECVSSLWIGVVKNDARFEAAVSFDMTEGLEDLQWTAVTASPAVGSLYSPTTLTELRWEQDPARNRLEAGQASCV